MIARQDNIVVHEWSAVIEDAEVQVIDRPSGHATPLFVHEVYALIDAWLIRHGVTRRSIDSIA